MLNEKGVDVVLIDKGKRYGLHELMVKSPFIPLLICVAWISEAPQELGFIPVIS